jgi:GNAT superfamily N-acetyltransferase
VSALVRLCRCVQDLHVRERAAIFKRLNDPEIQSWFEEMLTKTDARIWVAEIDSIVVGYVMAAEKRAHETLFTHASAWVEIDQISVHPDYHRKGIARALIDRVINTAWPEDLKAMALTTWAFNQAAREAFCQLGFVERTIRYEHR